jgi:hypothetical protein
MVPKAGHDRLKKLVLIGCAASLAAFIILGFCCKASFYSAHPSIQLRLKENVPACIAGVETTSLYDALYRYHRREGRFPFGDDRSVLASLNGSNPKHERFFLEDSGLTVAPSGEIVDSLNQPIILVLRGNHIRIDSRYMTIEGRTSQPEFQWKFVPHR